MRKPPTSGSENAASPATGQRADLARWFLALRPEAAAREALAGLARTFARQRGGRPVPAERVHLTLAFIGAAPRSFEAALIGLVRGLPPPPALALETIGSFDGRLLWIAPARPSAELDAVVAATRAGLERMGVPFDRKPFVPHLTLVRDARPTRGAALEALSALATPVRVSRPALHLVESFNDDRGLQYAFR